MEQSSMIISRYSNIIKVLCEKDSQLPISKFKFNMKGFGIRSKACQIQRAIFRIGLCIAINSLVSNHSFILMITASHNPPQDNGIKIGYADREIIEPSLLQQISSIINIQQALTQQILLKYFQKKLNGIKTLKDNFVYIGRDVRSSSSTLSDLLRFSLKLIAENVIDFGQLATPELFAVAKLCQSRQLNKYLFPIEIRNHFYEKVLNSFQQAINILSFKKKKIYLDFANGVGAVTFKHYRQRLQKYFQFKVVNDTNFNCPNVGCGAEYYQHHFSELPSKQDFDELYYFDGDCDRVILQIQQKNKPLANGENFNSIYAITLKKILQKIGRKDLKHGAVSNILANFGFSQFLKGQKIHHEITAVGVTNLFQAVQKYDVASYFESCGHGGIYIKPQFIQSLKQKQSLNLDQKILISLYTISSNTCKGYAFHNFLCLQICMLYLQLDDKHFFLFEKSFEKEKSFFVKNFNLYKASSNGQYLVQPKHISQKIKNFKQKYQNCRLIVRPSSTQEKIRVTVQGDQKQCIELFDKIIKIFQQQVIIV